MTYTLSFEHGPDAFQTGAPGDVCRTRVYIGVDGGTLTTLGTFDSPGESGNDGVREWGVQTVDVTATFDPAQDMKVYFESASPGGPFDVVHIRRLKIFDHLGTTWMPEYPKGCVYTTDQFNGIGLPGDFMGEDGGLLGEDAGRVYDRCTSAYVALTGDVRIWWFFSVNPVCPCDGGWLVGAVAIG